VIPEEYVRDGRAFIGLRDQDVLFAVACIEDALQCVRYVVKSVREVVQSVVDVVQCLRFGV
jgi:hypothetical protein